MGHGSTGSGAASCGVAKLGKCTYRTNRECHTDELGGSRRQLASEFDADPRVIQAAYRLLADKGLVVQRPRSGIFLRSRRVPLTQSGVSIVWLADIFSAAISRDIAAPQFVDVLRRALDSRTIKVATVASTLDQNDGMCRELRDDYGVQASCVAIDAIGESAPWPRALQEAHLIVTTPANESRVGSIAAELGTPMIVGAIRRDLVGPGWRRLLLSAVYVIVADRRFLVMLRGFFGSIPGSNNLRYLVAGEDDISAIPPMAPVYITSAAREVIGVRNVPGRPVPTARMFAPETARQILRFVVRHQLDAALAGAEPPSRGTRKSSHRLPASSVRSATLSQAKLPARIIGERAALSRSACDSSAVAVRPRR